MRFIHSCLRSSPYSTPPVPPIFALAPCPGPLTTPENSSRQLCESGGHKARMPEGGARHRPHLCNDPSGTAYEEHHGIYTFPTIPMSSKGTAIESVAIIAATGTAASTAVGVTALARGESRGAPGVSKALSRLGQSVGGGMLTGVAVATGTGALAGLVLYQGIQVGRS